MDQTPYESLYDAAHRGGLTMRLHTTHDHAIRPPSDEAAHVWISLKTPTGLLYSTKAMPAGRTLIAACRELHQHLQQNGVIA